MNRALAPLALFAVCVLHASCERKPAPSAPMAETPPAPTNRIDIPPTVRQNLGITFAKVESRDVARTLRVPGRFELTPSARREYRIPASGSVELLVHQYQSVEPGAALYRFESPRWREVQAELTDAEAAIALATARAESVGPLTEAHQGHHAAIERAIELWAARVQVLEDLQAAGGASGDDLAQARAALAGARSDLAETEETHVELAAQEREARAQLHAATARHAITLETAATLTGLSAEELLIQTAGRARWQTMGRIEVRAQSAGIVDTIAISSGTFLDQHAPVLTTVQPDQVCFRAHALQSDLGRLATGQSAAAVPPQGGTLGNAERIPGTLIVAPTADPLRRTIELVMTPTSGMPLVPWARAGVSGFLEIVVEGTGSPELAIPLACIARDGTQAVIFRRDPSDPDKAHRMEADLGIDDGRWVVIKSGVAEGNEIVLDGVYQLMVATSGSITKGGHFHPDGTFHEGDH